MIRREADRARIVGEVVQAERLRFAEQHAEDAAALRQLADRRLHVRVDPVGDEALEPRPGWVDHAERRVARPGQLRRRLQQPLESASSESSDVSAIPASTSARSRSWLDTVSMPTRLR